MNYFIKSLLINPIIQKLLMFCCGFLCCLTLWMFVATMPSGTLNILKPKTATQKIEERNIKDAMKCFFDSEAAFIELWKKNPIGKSKMHFAMFYDLNCQKAKKQCNLDFFNIQCGLLADEVAKHYVKQR